MTPDEKVKPKKPYGYPFQEKVKPKCETCRPVSEELCRICVEPEKVKPKCDNCKHAGVHVGVEPCYSKCFEFSAWEASE